MRFVTEVTQICVEVLFFFLLEAGSTNDKCPTGRVGAPFKDWCNLTGVQLKIWLPVVKADEEAAWDPHLYGLRQWNWKWVSITASTAADC